MRAQSQPGADAQERSHDALRLLWIASAEDLLTHPRHSLLPKGRKWLKAELRNLLTGGQR